MESPHLHSFGLQIPGKTAEQAQNDLLRQAQAVYDAVAELHGAPDDPAGMSVSAIREQGTGRILSIHITPVDLIDEIATLRFQTEPQGQTH